MRRCFAWSLGLLVVATGACGSSPNAPADGGATLDGAPIPTGELTSVWSLALRNVFTNTGIDTTPPGAIVAMAPDGSVYLAGTFNGTVDFAGAPATGTAGERNLFLARFTDAGKLSWVKSVNGMVSGSRLAVDGQGRAVLGGSFRGSVDFGSGVMTSTYPAQAYVAVYGAGGELAFVKSFPGTDDTYVSSLAVAGDDSIVVTGYFARTINAGGGDLAGSTGSAGNAYLARLDRNGAHVWSKAFPGVPVGTKNVRQLPYGVELDESDNIYIWGSYENISVDFGGGPLASPRADYTAAFMAKFTPAGAHAYSKLVALDTRGMLGAVAPNGNAAFCTYPVVAQTAAGVSIPKSSYFCTRLDPAGEEVAASVLTEVGVNFKPAGGKLENDGRLFLGAAMSSTLTLAGKELVAAFSGSYGPEDVLLLELSAEGALRVSKQAGDGARQVPYSIAFAGDRIAVVGSLDGTLDLGNGPLSGGGAGEHFFLGSLRR